MAKRLAELSISTTLISDAAVFAFMPKINKVIFGIFISNNSISKQRGDG